MIVVSDTSPRSNLMLIDHLYLLPQLYKQIIIPKGVAEELMRMKERRNVVEVLTNTRGRREPPAPVPEAPAEGLLA